MTDVPFSVVKCLPVEEPQNGRLISSAYEPNQEYTYGQVVKFECNAGFKLDGPAEIHCSGNGLWSRERPNCVGKMPLLLIVVVFFPHENRHRKNTVPPEESKGY